MIHAYDDDFSAVLADFSCQTSVKTLPAAAIKAAKRSTFDTLCCMAAGSSAGAVGDVHGLAVEWGGRPQANLLVYGERVPAHHAAWVNGTMAHACNYGDTHDGAVLQASVAVVPAALAAAQMVNASGSDFLAGVVVGLEAVCRLGVATRVGIVESGYTYTSLFGGFGATLAVSKIMGLQRHQAIHALGIAYSQVAGNQQATRDAALVKRIQPGFAAMSAVLSGQLALRDISGPQGTFDGMDGLFRVYLHGECDTDALREGLGSRYEMTQLSCKPYPCSRFTHAAIDAVLQLRARGLCAADLEVVRVGLNRQAYEAVRASSSKLALPSTQVEAQYSLAWTVAAAMVDGCVRLSHFTRQALSRPDLRLVALKVQAYVDVSIERATRRNVSPVRVDVGTLSGVQWVQEVTVPLGHPSRPMEMDHLEAKARDCFDASALPIHEGAASKLRSQVEVLESLPTVEQLVAVLKPEPKPLLFAHSG